MKHQFAATAVLAAGALAATSGDFNVLTMNVAGLPAILQGNDVPGDKTENSRMIGSLFSKYGYDIINVQEDFNYHSSIYETDSHPFRTATSGGVPFGTGENTLANFDWINFTRVKWDTCSNASGSDCLTPKGFSFMRVKIDEGVYVDVYNLHTDAGTKEEDVVARTSNVKQVSDYIKTRSEGNAVVVFGDTNSRYSRVNRDNIRIFSEQNGMKDAWVELIRGGVVPTAETLCENPSTTNYCETVDKVLYRGSPLLNLQATFWNYESTKFLQSNGSILSDHNPVTTNFTWNVASTMRQSNLFGGPHGTWFSDVKTVATKTKPKASILSFSGASRLDRVGVTLSDGTVFTHGGSGGTAASLTLASTEYWTSAQLCKGKSSDSTRNFYIKATTSTGRTVAAGTTTSDCATFTAPSGWQIVGFLGQVGDEVDQLGFVYAPR